MNPDKIGPDIFSRIKSCRSGFSQFGKLPSLLKPHEAGVVTQSANEPKMMPDMTKRARISPVRHVNQKPPQYKNINIDNTLTPLKIHPTKALESQRPLSLATGSHSNMRLFPDKKDKKSPNLPNITSITN